MQNKNNRGPLLNFLVIFLVLTMILFVLQNRSGNAGIDYNVMLVGNTILFIATLMSFFLYRRAYNKDNAQHIIKYIYSGLFLKMIICIIAAVAYILVARSAVNKLALLGCFILYIIYTFSEVKLLSQLGSRKKNV